ncbi:MAG: hypothetical protein A2Y77_14645 [Planctomycetes bacterium RBG_13_62_9]|nr:MAG: hypothetical protein A2Y77_14645 [Planctomycetes bacterium RBG_13_62_9]
MRLLPAKLLQLVFGSDEPDCGVTQEDSRNRRRNPHTLTGYKGLWRDKKTGKHWVKIHFEGRRIHLGPFATAIEAAPAYDRKAKELFGPFARLNLPEEHPEHNGTA